MQVALGGLQLRRAGVPASLSITPACSAFFKAARLPTRAIFARFSAAWPSSPGAAGFGA